MGHEGLWGSCRVPGTEQSGGAAGEAQEGQGRPRWAPVRDTGGLGVGGVSGFTWHEILTPLLQSRSSRREETGGSRDGKGLLGSPGP